jgi:hypothetical protein
MDMDKDLDQMAAEREEEAAAVRDLEKALDDWRRDWWQCVSRIGIAVDASPTAAPAVIDSLKEARNRLAEADVLRKRIDGIDRDAAAFRARVETLITAVILAGTVEQYRERHRGPLVSRAGKLFGQMTLAAFDRLRAEYDEKGNPAGGSRVGRLKQACAKGRCNASLADDCLGPAGRLGPVPGPELFSFRHSFSLLPAAESPTSSYTSKPPCG